MINVLNNNLRMKICNLCNQIYTDETNFCLEDGSTLRVFHDPGSGQNVTAPSAPEQEAPTVVRFDGIPKSQKPKQMARFVKNTMIGTSIFFLLATVYTASVIPLIVGIIVEVLLFAGAKIYTRL
jgi:hypothetical protein